MVFSHFHCDRIQADIMELQDISRVAQFFKA